MQPDIKGKRKKEKGRKTFLNRQNLTFSFSLFPS